MKTYSDHKSSNFIGHNIFFLHTYRYGYLTPYIITIIWVENNERQKKFLLQYVKK
jgi:hypothetical protein